MAPKRDERRLAAVLAADMVGYSRLMEADERGTIARQKAHRSETIDPKITEYKGRIVKLMGDGMLVEFASIVNAVECAVDIQKYMAQRSDIVPKDLRIELRIGINLGNHHGNGRRDHQCESNGHPQCDIARLLRMTKFTQVIVIDRLTRGYDGTSLEWRRSRGPADQFHYHTDIC